MVKAKNIVHVKNIIKMGDSSSGQSKASSGGGVQPSPVMPITWKPAEFDYPSLAKTAAGMKQIQEEVLKQPGKPVTPTYGVNMPPGKPEQPMMTPLKMKPVKTRRKKVPTLDKMLKEDLVKLAKADGIDEDFARSLLKANLIGVLRDKRSERQEKEKAAKIEEEEQLDIKGRANHQEAPPLGYPKPCYFDNPWALGSSVHR